MEIYLNYILYDPDYSFTFELINEPLGMVLESFTTSALISYIPNDEQNSFSFELIVYDNQGLSDSKTYNVLIVEENNQLPIIIFQIQILQFDVF